MRSVKKRILSVALSLTMLLGVSILPASISVDAANLNSLSSGYKKNGNVESKYYRQLKNTVNDINASNKTNPTTYMNATARIAESQVGYSCYATFGDSSAVRWNGISARMNGYYTGNTEYTRWFFTDVIKDAKNRSNRYADLDWCAIFASWCMFHSGYHANNSDKYIVYSSCADPRKDLGKGERWTAFNGAEGKCWYTKTGTIALNEQSWVYHEWSGFNGYKDFKTWNKNVASNHRNRSALYKYTSNGKTVNANGIPYKRGGLVFFDWEQDGKFNHVAIVKKVSGNTLTIIEGNARAGGIGGTHSGNSSVRITTVNLKTQGKFIAAYMEY